MKMSCCRNIVDCARAPRAAIVAIWLGFNAWYLFAEGFTRGRPGTAAAGYAAVVADGLMHRDTWMRIVADGRAIGYSNSRLDIDEYAPGGRYVLSNETVAELPLWGSAHRTLIRSRVVLDAARQLTEFDLALEVGGERFRLRGRHAGGRVFEIDAQGPIGLPFNRITLPREAVIMPPTAEIGLRRARPGRRFGLRVFDPLSMRAMPLNVNFLRRELLEHRGRMRETTVMAMQYQGMTLHGWIDDEGNLLRQETPLGWILEACDPADALPFMRPEKPL